MEEARFDPHPLSDVILIQGAENIGERAFGSHPAADEMLRKMPSPATEFEKLSQSGADDTARRMLSVRNAASSWAIPIKPIYQQAWSNGRT